MLFFALALIVSGILVYAGVALYTDKVVYRKFDAGGYSYLYQGGADATTHFVSHPYGDAQREILAGYLLQANLLATDTTEQRISKLSKFILDRLDDTRGTPDDSWYEETEFDQFQQVWNKELSGIHCTQFRHVFASLANEAGIPTRVVHSGVTVGPDTRFRDWSVSGHTFSESYIAETGDWAIVDLHTGFILIRDADGRFLNTIDLYDIMMGHRQGDDFELAAYDSPAQAIRSTRFGTSDDLAAFFFGNTAYRVFFQEYNQKFRYERNDRGKYYFRPYSGPITDRLLRKRFYALAGAGALLALFSCIYFIGPLRNGVRRMFGSSA